MSQMYAYLSNILPLAAVVVFFLDFQFLSILSLICRALLELHFSGMNLVLKRLWTMSRKGTFLVVSGSSFAVIAYISHFHILLLAYLAT